MCARSANFNSAIFLAACGLLTIGSGGDIVNDGPLPVLRNDSRCSPLLSVALSSDSILLTETSQTHEKNGSLFYDGFLYPADLYWTDGNVTYVCVCKLRNCIRKCCRGDEVLAENIQRKQPVCQKIFHNDTMPAREEIKTQDLRLSKEQMAEEIQHVDKLKDHFLLLESSVCPAGTYTLDPNEFQEKKYILQANGSLVNADEEIFSFWNYCIDWQMNFERIDILICVTPETPNEEADTAHHVGIAVSIPFLVATFLVYAIIPELKNLYGKTLMCYVICLIIAYVFLLLVNYIYISSIPALCFITGKQPPYRWSNSFAFRYFNICLIMIEIAYFFPPYIFGSSVTF